MVDIEFKAVDLYSIFKSKVKIYYAICSPNAHNEFACIVAIKFTHATPTRDGAEDGALRNDATDLVPFSKRILF